MSLFSGQGRVYVAPIVNNVVGSFRWLGNVPDFNPSFETSKLEKKESYTGARGVLAVITTENKSKVSITLDEWDNDNLALAVRGTTKNVVAGAVATGDNEVIIPTGATPQIGDIYTLANQGVTSLVVQDSAGSPVTLVAGTDYSVNEQFGTITVLADLSAFTLPIRADSYSFSTTSYVPFFTQGSPEFALRFEGVNTANNNSAVFAELYKIQFDPTQDIPLITDDFASFVLEGTALVDSSKPADGDLGQFGRVSLIGA